MDTKTVAELLSRSALYASLAACFKRPGTSSFAPLAEEAPPAWREELRTLAAREPERERTYSAVIGGTGTLNDSEISYRPSLPAGAILGDLAGFYLAFDFPADPAEKPDHVSVELDFVSFLFAREAFATADGSAEGAEIVRDGRRKFLDFHLARWIQAFAAIAEQMAPGSVFSRGAAAVLRAVGEEVPVGEGDPVTSDSDAPFGCGECPVGRES